MSTGSNQPPGWYHAQGDPPDTHRWWDGAQWVGGPQPLSAPAPGGAPSWSPPGSAVPGGRPLAGPWERIGARLIDWIIVGIVAAIVSAILGLDGGALSLGRALVQTVLGAVYVITMIGLRGATVGKMALGIAVVRQFDGVTPPGIDVSVRRWIVEIVGLFTFVGALVSLVIFIVSLVYLFTDPMRRTVHDRIGRTFVVKMK